MQGFQSLFLLHGCAMCAVSVKFSFHVPLPYCSHKVLICLRREIRCVCKLTEILLMGMQATSDEIVCVTVCRHCLYVGNPTHSYQKRGFYSSLCMSEYTDEDKEIDFPASQYVHSHIQTLVWLPILSMCMCAICSSFKGYCVVLYFLMMLKKCSSNFALIGYHKRRFVKYLFVQTPWSFYNHIAEMSVTVIKKEA